MKQQRRVIGYEQEYPGAYQWPIKEVFCPSCKQWVSDFGNVDERDDDGDWHMMCIPCGEQAWNEVERQGVHHAMDNG